jgi:GT2 family glycosyltransferase
MSRKIIYISDFFVNHIIGGGELNDDELIKLLVGSDKEVECTQSHLVTEDLIKSNLNSFYIISNFSNLDYAIKERITYECDYIIYEHDHKYLDTRNPIFYKDLKAPKVSFRNYFFYKNAKKIFCQTDYHKDIIENNLKLDNIIAVNGNLWSIEILQKLSTLSKKNKKDKISILNSRTGHKNTAGAIDFCNKKKLEYELIEDKNYERFLNKLSNNKKFVFLPRSPETLSRVVCEARMMNIALVLNQMVGAGHESWFELKGQELIQYMIERRDHILNLVISELESPKIERTDKKISIITTFHKADEFLESYLENITRQTIFNKCELILVDSDSPGNERKTVEKYMKKFDNIFYYRYNHNFKPTIGHNIGIMKSNCQFIVWAMIDDRKSIDGIQVLYDRIKSDDNFELVYGDCISTDIKNENVETTKSTKLSEHSIMPFSKENMIKCLPGPMPMWRARLHEKVGFFDEINHNFSDDWDLWLRAINNNCIFSKVERIVGLYMEGGRSQWDNNLEQKKEEARIFFKNSHIFGENYEKYKMYFSQFLEIK